MKHHSSSSNTMKAPCHLYYERRFSSTGLYITRSDPCYKERKFLRGAISAFQYSRIAGSDSCHSCGRRLLLQSGPDDSADDLIPFYFSLCPVGRLISRLPNGSRDGGCKIPPGPGQNPPKFLPRLTPIWLKSKDCDFLGKPPFEKLSVASIVV